MAAAKTPTTVDRWGGRMGGWGSELQRKKMMRMGGEMNSGMDI